ncbi:MAG: type IV pili methyl-accepting chemotaxis transducer N-terminal domain-containing protein [Chloroflexi bacterium]|nr:type IV pili methyl-accepting chemotaxis transducer N-terminal domain-containing protein [Chloroflexota bacterium]
MFRSLRAQLSAIFLGFLLLVGGSVTATFLAVHTQANDATLINLAGRQRMLTQKMTWLALTQPENPDLAASIQSFDQTLRALGDGGSVLDPAGQVVTLPPAPDLTLRAQLDEIIQMWTTYRAHLEGFDTPTPNEPVPAKTGQALQTESSRLLAQLDSIVSGFEARAEAKLRRLQLIQAVFFVAALLLLAWGYLLTRRRILSPLAALRSATQRIAEGYLTEPVLVIGSDELGDLGQAFEAMRTEVAAVHDQLESRVVQRTHELTIAFEFSQEIVSQLDLGHLLRSVTDRARVLTRGEVTSLCLLNEEGTTLTLVARSGDGIHLAELQQLVKPGLVEQVVGGGRSIANEVACFNCGFLNTHASEQCVAAPLRAGEYTLGALCVVRPAQERFDPDEVRALTLLANSAATAITNARLVEVGRRQAEQAATLTERERLAAELHDHLTQTLSFLNLKADRVIEILTAADITTAKTELDRMKAAISQIYGQVRAALVGLREPLLAADSSIPSTEPALAEKLTTCLADFRESSGLPTDLIIADPAALALSRVTQAQALHIVREALTNVRRHAQARQVWVRVEQVIGEACFTVEDDGCGFDRAGIESDHHLGLTIMQARAERSGGRLIINSTPNAGTKVVACFSLAAPGAER